jgi:hypothetical protein
LFDRVLHNLENLDELFLQQGNPRKTIREKAFVRVGKLRHHALT